MMNEAAQAVMKRYYDFLVRYEELLSLDTTDAAARTDALAIDGVETGGLRSRDRVAVIARRGAAGREPAAETFSLVNLMGLSTGRWETALAGGPTPLHDLAVRIAVERPVARVWEASPDRDDLAAQPLDFAAGEDEGGAFVAFTLPRLDYWSMIVLEYE
ncbi:MAG: glycoside hydrolase family 66 protein [Anaerolineae bacterium]|nr:glycoside hydrolase family 66 protein [Anaerolineae bacterium]